MSALERLRAAIVRETASLRTLVPGDRAAAIVALVREIDRLPTVVDPGVFDSITRVALPNLGGNRALALCFEAPEQPVSATGSEEWATGFLRQCARLCQLELIAQSCESGGLRLVEREEGGFEARPASKRIPPVWRERFDYHWWGAQLAKEPNARPLERMAHQFGYPPEAELGGATARVHRAVLSALITIERTAHQRGESPIVASERELIADLAIRENVTRVDAGIVLGALTLDAENAGYHATVPGIEAAPVVRTAPDRLVLSHFGLTSEPLLFLTREIRRQNPEAYHNASHHRESVFRNDLYALFADKRFVCSPARIQLKRAAGDLRTDIDAAVFDRKTASLALFELKSQDPFARSHAEFLRQRDNVLQANRQIAGALDWVKRNGADEILGRLDAKAAKTFRVQKVYPFVLGRYLAHFQDGPAPDTRAAWGTWPQVLRLLGGEPVRGGDANPIASLHARLAKDPPPFFVPPSFEPRAIELGEIRVTVLPSQTGPK